MRELRNDHQFSHKLVILKQHELDDFSKKYGFIVEQTFKSPFIENRM